MSEFLRLLAQTYYTIPVMVGFQFAAGIISFRNRHKFPELRSFYLYPLIGILQTIISLSSMIFLDQTISDRIEQFSVNIFSISEATLFLLLSVRVLIIRKSKTVIKVLYIGFIVYTIYLIFFTDEIFHNSSRVICAESSVILTATYFYLFEIFSVQTSEKITDHPAFWINIGFLFVFSCTLPITTLDFFRRTVSFYYLYYVNFITYSILYLLIIRAYLCNVYIGHQEETWTQPQMLRENSNKQLSKVESKDWIL